MGSVARQARLLDSITADLLTVAQIQRGTLRVDMESVDPGMLIEGVVGLRYDAEVIVEDGRAVRADPMRLEQMIDNLLGNALVHGRAPYTVRVRPHRPAGVIDVVDEGDGVPPELPPPAVRRVPPARTSKVAERLRARPLRGAHPRPRPGSAPLRVHPAAARGSVFTITLNAC